MYHLNRGGTGQTKSMKLLRNGLTAEFIGAQLLTFIHFNSMLRVLIALKVPKDALRNILKTPPHRGSAHPVARKKLWEGPGAPCEKAAVEARASILRPRLSDGLSTAAESIIRAPSSDYFAGDIGMAMSALVHLQNQHCFYANLANAPRWFLLAARMSETAVPGICDNY